MDDPMSSFATAFTVPSPPPATMIWLFSFTARRANSGISAPLDARRMRAGVLLSANIRESFSRSSGPGRQSEALLRMQVKPEHAAWFPLFDRRMLSLGATIRKPDPANSSLEDAKLNGSCQPQTLSLFALQKRSPLNGRQSGSCARLDAT